MTRTTTILASLLCGATLLGAGAAPAAAHIVFEQKQAAAGTYFKGTLLVGHGCSGSATRAVTVTIPESVHGAHPQPKPGWKLDVGRVAVADPFESHGKTMREDVRTLRWHGGTIADAHFDDFAILMRLPDTPGKLYFKVKQECENGTMEWSQVPVEGQSLKDLKTPAALLEVLPRETASASAR